MQPIIDIEGYKINPYTEAKMIWLSGGKWKNENEKNISDEKLLLQTCEVKDETELLAWVFDFIEKELPSLSVETWVHEADLRTQYIDKCQKFYDDGKGFPIDYRLLNNYIKKGFKICSYFTNMVNEKYGAIFIYDKNYKKFKINKPRLANLLNIPLDDNFDSSSVISNLKYHPQYSMIYRAEQANRVLLGPTAYELLSLLSEDNYIKGGYKPLAARTGRNSQQLTKGFVLQADPWFRSIIRPHKGKAFIGFDWSGQEQYVAAILTGDTKLTKGYRDGDVYTVIGRELGIMSAGENKQNSPTKREKAKLVAQKLSYGMGESTLETQIENGGGFLRKHKEMFREYWDWIENNTKTSFEKGYYKTRDGWIYVLLEGLTARHLMLNIPMQSEAAGMMRKAVMLLPSHIDLVGTHHDALYINCDEDKVIETEKLVKDVMNKAAMEYFDVDWAPFVESKIIRNKDNWKDKRGLDFLKIIKTM